MAASCHVVMVRRGGPDDSPSPVTIHGLPVWDRLAEGLRSRGHHFWIDISDAKLGDRPLVLIWDFGSVARLPRRLLDRAGGRVVAWCLESPLVAHRAFHRLHAIARDSACVLTFEGARVQVEAAGGRFRSIAYPIPQSSVQKDFPWSDRRFLTMINSNKNVTPGLRELNWKQPVASMRKLAASALARSYAWRGSWASTDMYRERARALAHFAQRQDFDLYGNGWDRKVAGVSESGERGIRARYQGTAAAKNDVLARYRFCLAFENTAFSGYITEKIFDCFFAGTIPVYLGAPDIDRMVPTEAFVDGRQYRTFDSLEGYLRSMSRETARAHLDAAADFVTSERFRPFSEQTFVDVFLEAIEDAAA